MQSHSLFHAAGKAHCKTPWAKMSGSDSVRTCPDCRAIAYKLEGLSEEDAASLVTGHESAPLERLHLSRRKDGTFTTSARPCTVLTIPCAYIHDWTDSIRLIIRVLRSCSRLTAGWVLVSVMPFKQLMGLPLMLVLQAIKCRLVGACSEELNGGQWQPDKAEFDQYWPIIGNQMVYYFAIYAALIAFIVPGVICAVRGCLGLTIVYLERCGPVEAFKRSFALTKGSVKPILRYFAIPFLTYGLLSVVPTIVAVLLCLPVGIHSSLWTVIMIALGTFAIVPTFFLLTFVPMQVRLYYRLKGNVEANAGLQPPLQLAESRLPAADMIDSPSDSVTRTDL